MSAAVWTWAQFAACVLAIGWAGVHLVRHGDTIAAVSGLSRSWVGLILVATVTSLPELVTGLSAVLVARAPDLAAGDALGSCVFNLALLGLLDLMHRGGSVYAAFGPGHRSASGHAVGMLLLLAAALLLAPLGVLPAVGHVSLASIALTFGYLMAMRALYRAEAPSAPTRAAPGGAIGTAVRGYIGCSVVVAAAGTWLSVTGVQLADIMGWSNTFVGATLVAFATSVPELVTTVAAARRGAVDMAIGNLLGSNLFDLQILAIDDLAYLDGPLPDALPPAALGVVLTTVAMYCVLAVAAARPPARRVAGLLGWPSLALLALYGLNGLLQFVV